MAASFHTTRNTVNSRPSFPSPSAILLSYRALVVIYLPCIFLSSTPPSPPNLLHLVATLFTQHTLFVCPSPLLFSLLVVSSMSAAKDFLQSSKCIRGHRPTTCARSPTWAPRYVYVRLSEFRISQPKTLHCIAPCDGHQATDAQRCGSNLQKAVNPTCQPHTQTQTYQPPLPRCPELPTRSAFLVYSRAQIATRDTFRRFGLHNSAVLLI